MFVGFKQQVFILYFLLINSITYKFLSGRNKYFFSPTNSWFDKCLKLLFQAIFYVYTVCLMRMTNITGK